MSFEAYGIQRDIVLRYIMYRHGAPMTNDYAKKLKRFQQRN